MIYNSRNHILRQDRDIRREIIGLEVLIITLFRFGLAIPKYMIVEVVRFGEICFVETSYGDW